MEDVKMKILIGDNGKIQVVDRNDKPVPSKSTRAFETAFKKAKFEKIMPAMIMWTNPCRWVNINGRWYWICT